jgi:hypothetical protein
MKVYELAPASDRASHILLCDDVPIARYTELQTAERVRSEFIENIAAECERNTAQDVTPA